MTRYVSTRGDAPVLDFADTLLTGLAIDGGLYVPDELPPLPADAWDRWREQPYAAVAVDVLADLVAPSLTRDELVPLVDAAYATFDHPDVVPLTPLGDGVHLLELFHGPTLSFKDVALQLLGRLFEHELTRRRRSVTIVGATSGDTGSAAIEACRDRDGIELFMLHPKGRVSEVQRKQMTTVASPNIHNIAVEGTFDDCQDLVKALFADRSFRNEVGLASVNSINWARVAAQSVYYVTAALALGAPDRRVAFTVPTGNFGNVYSGLVSQRRGLPVAGFTIASNRNDILTRYVRDGDMSISDVEPSLTPAMDIQISSNFERLLFEAVGRDGVRLAEMMTEFRRTGVLPADAAALDAVRAAVCAQRRSDDETLATIASVHAGHGILIDPHTAVGVGAALDARDAGSRCASADEMVVLSCAHPAKFGDTVRRATGVDPVIPQRVAEQLEAPERYREMAADRAELQALIRAKVKA